MSKSNYTWNSPRFSLPRLHSQCKQAAQLGPSCLPPACLQASLSRQGVAPEPPASQSPLPSEAPNWSAQASVQGSLLLLDHCWTGTAGSSTGRGRRLSGRCREGLFLHSARCSKRYLLPQSGHHLLPQGKCGIPSSSWVMRKLWVAPHPMLKATALGPAPCFPLGLATNSFQDPSMGRLTHPPRSSEQHTLQAPGAAAANFSAQPRQML